MMLRDELDEWMTAAPPWLGRILRSHLEALDLLESHEAEAAALRGALIAALPMLQQPAAEPAPSLLSLALGEGPAAPTSSPAVARIEEALNASAGHSLLEDFRELRAQHSQALDALDGLLAWAAAHPDLPAALAERARALLSPSRSAP